MEKYGGINVASLRKDIKRFLGEFSNRFSELLEDLRRGRNEEYRLL